MMTAQIRLQSQLNTFEIIRNILLVNSTLSEKFKSGDFYEFQPKVKAPDFNGYPYFLIEMPTTEELPEYIGNRTDENSFNVTITMKIEYEARNKIRSYSNEILRALRDAVAELRSYGYEYVSSILDESPEPTLENQKAIYETVFELTLRGEVR